MSGTGSRPPPTAASSSCTPRTPSRWSRWRGRGGCWRPRTSSSANAWGDEGTTREQHAWTADPNLVRRLEVGQACYIQRGAATFVQVARPRPSPLTLLPAARPAAPGPGARAAPGPGP